ncbi:MAG: GNAT family N-acetyltransferase, partial [Terriglobia bacterium]
MNLQTQEAVTTSIPVIRPFEEAFASEWDQFVLEHADGTLFHTIAWKRTIERAFGFSSRYLVALRGNTVCGILPLFLVSNWVLGSTLISTPFAVYGGLVANDDSARQALCDTARQMAVDESVEYLEMRELHGSLGGDFQTKQLYVTFEGELPRDPLRLLQQLPKDTRYMVRKGQKNGLRAVRDNGQLDAFYHVYAHSVRHLGTPVFAKRFFEILLEEFKEAVEITMIWHGRTAVAGVFSFRFRDRLLP